jgi:hypothetical protein
VFCFFVGKKNKVLDLCALAHQVHTTVSTLFNRDGDNLVSSDEFLMGECLRPLFHDNVRVPIRKGDVVRVKDTSKNTDTFKHAVVIGWQQRSHWHPIDKQTLKTTRRGSTLHVVHPGGTSTSGGEPTNSTMSGLSEDISSSGDGPTSPLPHDEMSGGDTDDFQFHGTVFLVRFFSIKDRNEYPSGVVIPKPSSKTHAHLLRKGEIHAVPENALCWKSIRCDEFVKAILAHSDWLFDSDGRCAISDHRCVPIARDNKKKM